MKKVLTFLAALLCGSAAFAQETPAKYSLYGFVRNYAVFDTRESSAGAQDLYFYMPKGVNLVDGKDVNAMPSFRMYSLTTRLGLRVAGYQFGATKVDGTVEADFYSMNGAVAVLRMRQAYVGLGWDFSADNKLVLNIGQTWHPLAADMPHVTNLETGAPFNPFNRSPQVMAHYDIDGRFTLTGGFLFPMQYQPTGPEGKSSNYNKYALLPEAYLGLSYKEGGFLGRLGLNVLTIKPYYKASGLMAAVTPMLYLQYTDGMFQIKGKSVLAQAGEHLNLLSGYGVSSYDAAKDAYRYTPMQDWASFVSVQYGKKFQVLGMLGYMKQLYATTDLLDAKDLLWLNTSADTSIHQAVRFTPTVVWNLGKLSFSLEYNLTAAQFGVGVRNIHGGFDDKGDWVLNHRFIWMTKFSF